MRVTKIEHNNLDQSHVIPFNYYFMVIQLISTSTWTPTYPSKNFSGSPSNCVENILRLWDMCSPLVYMKAQLLEERRKGIVIKVFISIRVHSIDSSASNSPIFSQPRTGSTSAASEKQPRHERGDYGVQKRSQLSSPVLLYLRNACPLGFANSGYIHFITGSELGRMYFRFLPPHLGAPCVQRLELYRV